jgi:NTE family protein
MNAFVFSGGGNLGSIQAGMAQALLEARIRPDILVGTSIGAANAAVLAGDPTPEGGARLVEMWSKAKGKHIFPIRPTKLVRQLLGKGALFSPGPFARFVKAGLSFTAIEDALVPLRIVATRFDDGAEHVFEAGPVMDAVLASTALPLIYPAHDVAGTLYLDGG